MQAGHKVVLIAPYDKEEIVEGVRIRGLPKAKDRLERTSRILWKIYKAAIEERADIYHFHDLELIPVGLLLKLRGKRVIYDVHEDYSQVLLSREWIPFWLRGIVTTMVIFEEWLGPKFFDGVVAATPYIAKRFPESKTLKVQNFSIIDEFSGQTCEHYGERLPVVVYLGAISVPRGIREMVQAMSYLPKTFEAQLWMAGRFSPTHLKEEISQLPGWDRVNFLGWQSHKDAVSILGKARLGLALLHPEPNHIKSQPNKLFECMAAGIPVIASDFPIWRKIIEGAECGILVDPFDIETVAESIKWLMEHPEEAEKMGKRGQEAVLKHYNWEIEAKKLLAFYKKIIKG